MFWRILAYFLLCLAFSTSWALSDACRQANELSAQVAQQYQQGYYKKALPLAKQALALSRKEPEDAYACLSIALHNLASLYFKQSKLSEAIPLLAELSVLEAVKFGKDSLEYASVLDAQGAVYVQLGQYAAAAPLLKQALRIYRKQDDRHPDYAKALNNLGSLYYFIGNYPAAEKYLQQAATLRRDVLPENDPQRISDLNNQGALYLDMGEYQKAEQVFTDALILSEKIQSKHHPDYANYLSNLGVVLMEQENYERAEQLFRQALEIRKQGLGKTHPAYITTLNNLADLHRRQADYADAEQLYQQALALRKQAVGEYHPDYANSLNNFGEYYRTIGAYYSAETYFQQALRIKRDRLGESSVDYALSLSNLGELYRNQGDYLKAEKHFLYALEIYRNALGEEHAKYANMLNNLGVLYIDFGLYEQAGTYLRQAKNLRETLFGERSRPYANTYGNLAELYRVANHSRAKTYIPYNVSLSKEVFGEKHPDYANALNKAAVYFEAKEDYSHAEACYLELLAIYRRALGENHPEYARALGNLAVLYQHSGQATKAEHTYRQALRSSVGLTTRWRIQANFANFLARQVRLTQALEQYLYAIEYLESQRSVFAGQKTDFFRDKAKVYDELLHVLRRLTAAEPQQNHARLAFEVFERKQGRQFLADMGQSGARRYGAVPESIIEREADLARQIAHIEQALSIDRGKSIIHQNKAKMGNMQARLNALNQQAQALDLRIAKQYPVYARLRHPQPVTVEILQDEVLQADEVMLAYAVLPALKDSEAFQEQSLLWLISRDDFKMYTLPQGRDALAQTIKALDWNLEVAPNKLKHDLHELYQQLIPQAARPALKGKSLYIVPTQDLYQLPFGALVAHPIEDARNVRYLLEDHAITYISSASLLKTLRDTETGRKKAPYPLLAFADPVYAGKRSPPPRSEYVKASRQLLRDSGLIPLPESAEEARQVKNWLGTAHSQVFLREQATKKQLLSLNASGRLQNYRHLLFALHGVFPPPKSAVNQPMLAFSQIDNEAEFYLTTREIYALKLNADLVMLSACSSGAGEAKNIHEGIRGLTGAFLYAGSSSVTATLWKVRDSAARAISAGMFEGLTNGCQTGCQPAEALRQAKLALLQSRHKESADKNHDFWSHPGAWAGFVLFGEGNRKELKHAHR